MNKKQQKNIDNDFIQCYTYSIKLMERRENLMGLDHFFDKNLVFCLEADNQEHLFDQVATLLEEREIVTPTYREALKVAT